ncbi:hypothetical protein ABKN59_006944 [Abortiporus biennis]
MRMFVVKIRKQHQIASILSEPRGIAILRTNPVSTKLSDRIILLGSSCEYRGKVSQHLVVKNPQVRVCRSLDGLRMTEIHSEMARSLYSDALYANLTDTADNQSGNWDGGVMAIAIYLCSANCRNNRTEPVNNLCSGQNTPDVQHARCISVEGDVRLVAWMLNIERCTPGSPDKSRISVLHYPLRLLSARGSYCLAASAFESINNTSIVHLSFSQDIGPKFTQIQV